MEDIVSKLSFAAGLLKPQHLLLAELLAEARDEIVLSRKFIDKAFLAHPNLDLDIKNAPDPT